MKNNECAPRDPTLILPFRGNKFIRRDFLALLFALAVASAYFPAISAAQDYIAIPITGPDGSIFFAQGLNDNGEVVGVAGPHGIQQPAIWSQKDGGRLLSLFTPVSPADASGEANAINNAGEAVGSLGGLYAEGSAIVLDKPEATHWRSGGTIHPCPRRNGSAYDVNKSGHSVGAFPESTRSARDQPFAFYWNTWCLPLSGIDPLVDEIGSAVAVADILLPEKYGFPTLMESQLIFKDGTVVAPKEAILWRGGGTPFLPFRVPKTDKITINPRTVLGVTDGTGPVFPEDLDPTGQFAIGWHQSLPEPGQDFFDRAWLYTVDTAVSEALGTLSQDPEDHTHAFPVNSHKQLVGFSVLHHLQDAPNDAFLWTQGAGMKSLDTLIVGNPVLDLERAIAINEKQQIVAADQGLNNYYLLELVNPQLSVSKQGTVHHFGLPAAGNTIEYSIRVENTGNVTLTDVTVTDPLLGAVTCPGGNPIPSLGAGILATCNGDYVITQQDIENHGVTNTAGASGMDHRNQPVMASSGPHLTEIVTNLVPWIQKVGTLDPGGDGVATPGDLIDYQFDVRNLGNLEMADVTITDPAVPVPTCPGGHPIPLILPLAQVICTGSYAITQADIDAGSFTNTAVVATASGPDQAMDTHHLTLDEVLKISLVKSGLLDPGSDGMATPGDLVSYEFLVSNTSNVTLSDIVVTDPLIPVIPCTGGNPLPTLDPGFSEACTGTYAISQADIDAGQLDNTALAAGEDPDSNPVSHADTHHLAIRKVSGISLDKTGALALGGDGIGHPGELINYSFEVSNTGNIALSDVTISDSLVASISCPGGHPIATLAPQSTVICTGSYAITQVDIDAGSKDNNASAAGTDIDGGPVSDMDSHSEPIPQAPLMALEKEGSLDLGPGGFANPGDLIHYTIKVTNTGNVDLFDIAITDSIVPGITCSGGTPIPSLAPLESVTCTGEYAITSVDIVLRQKVNHASALAREMTGEQVTAHDSARTAIPTPIIPANNMLGLMLLIILTGGIAMVFLRARSV